MTNNLIKIKLPDGNIKTYKNAVTPLDVAGDISISLKKMLLYLE